MPQLFIPAIGTELILAQDWNFQLFEERRNMTLIDYMAMTGCLGARKPVTPSRSVVAGYDAFLPAGSVLQVDRIYIRKKPIDFEGLAFLLKDAKAPPKIVKGVTVRHDGRDRIEEPYEKKVPARRVRFWVTMEDTNKIQFR